MASWRMKSSSSSSPYIKRCIIQLLLSIVIFQCALVIPFYEHSASHIVANAENVDDSGGGGSAKASPENDNYEDMDWGTFYDPKSMFCGKYDCYKILGFDYFTFDKVQPTHKDITKSYRSLSRRFHPDKNRAEGAKERFVMIARAYEVLTDKERRKEYDYFRDRPDEYLHKYGSSVMWQYAPKSDVRVIIFLLLTCASLFTWFVQLQRWKTIADHLTKAAVEDLGKREGGSTESIEIRREALAILEQRQQDAAKHEANGNNGTTTKMPKKKSVDKASKKEKKEKEKEELRKIVEGLVNEIHDFGGGFRKPTWKDVFVVKIFFLPVAIFRSVSWGFLYYARRLRGLPYSDDELEVMTKRAVGQVAWDACTPEEHEEMKTKELWVTKNLEEWKEDQEIKILSPGERKQANRWRKKHGSKLE